MLISLIVLQSLLILSSPVLSQSNIIKPDVTFGDYNDRFDVSDLVSYQNKYFRADGSIDYRRSPNGKKRFLDSDKNKEKYISKVRKDADEELNRLANIILLRMTSRRSADDNRPETEVFNENRKKFGEPSAYRKTDVVPDTFNYAFPIDMQVEGFLVPPENR